MKIFQPTIGLQGPPGNMTIGQPVGGGTPKEILYIDNSGNLFSDSNATRDSVTHDTILNKTGLSAFDSGFNFGTLTGFGLEGTAQFLNNPLGGGSSFLQIDGALYSQPDTISLLLNDDATGTYSSQILQHSQFGGWDIENFATSELVKLQVGLSGNTGNMITGFKLRYDDGVGLDVAFIGDGTGVGWSDDLNSLTYYLPLTAPTAGQVMGTTAGLPTGGQLEWITPAGGGTVTSVTDDGNGVVTVDNTIPADPVIGFAGVNVDGVTITGNGTSINPLVAVGAAAALTATYIGYGSGTNLLTGDANFTWDAASKIFSIFNGGTGSPIVTFSAATGLYATGDLGNTVNGWITGVNTTSRTFFAGDANSMENGMFIFLDDVGQTAGMGDLLDVVNNTSLLIDDSARTISLGGKYGATSGTGLLLDFTNKTFVLGDGANVSNRTKITVSDALNRIHSETYVTGALHSLFYADLATNKTTFGYDAGNAVTSGSGNSMFGHNAGKLITTASNNTAIGGSALAFNTGGLQNTAIGSRASFNLNNADNNIAIGFEAGFTTTTGTNNVFIGSYADSNLNTGQNRIALGVSASATSNNQMMIGSTAMRISELVFGSGDSDPAVANASILRTTNGSGTDAVGADLVLIPGLATGNAITGDILFKSAIAGVSSNVLQTASTWGSIRPSIVKFGDIDSIVNDTVLTVDASSSNIHLAAGSVNNTAFDLNDTTQIASILSSRFEEAMGTSTASANDLTLPANGNLVVITGNTTINAITTSGWTAGSHVTLIFTGTPTVKHNTAGGAGTATILLAGSVDLAASSNTVLKLVWDGTNWQQEASKSAAGVIASGLTNGRVVYTQSGVLADDSDMVFDGSHLYLGKALVFTSYAGITTDGAIWNDSAQNAIQARVSGIDQSLVGTAFTQTGDQTVANTTTPTTMFGGGVGTLTLPANFFKAGKTVRVDIQGYHSSTGNPNITVDIKLGSTVVATGTGVSGNGSTDGFTVSAQVTCRTTGATGTVAASGWYDEWHTSGEKMGLVQTGTTTIDTTASQVLDVVVTWGTADPGNTITSQIASVEVLN